MLPLGKGNRQEQLAIEVTTQYHGPEATLQARQAAKAVAGGKPEDAGAIEFSLNSIQFPAKLFYILSAAGLCSSSSEARRQIQGGAVRLGMEN